MSTQSPKKCNWPECPNPPAGCFCSRCRKRMYRLGYRVTPADMPPAEVLADLERLWANRQPTVAELAAQPTPAAEPAEASDKVIRASLHYEIGALRHQVETLRQENVAANEELRLTALAIYGEDHDAHELHKEADVLRREVLQLRGLDREQARQPREVEYYIAGQLLDELRAAADGAPTLERTVAMLRAVVTGKVPRG